VGGRERTAFHTGRTFLSYQGMKNTYFDRVHTISLPFCPRYDSTTTIFTPLPPPPTMYTVSNYYPPLVGNGESSPLTMCLTVWRAMVSLPLGSETITVFFGSGGGRGGALLVIGRSIAIVKPVESNIKLQTSSTAITMGLSPLATIILRVDQLHGSRGQPNHRGTRLLLCTKPRHAAACLDTLEWCHLLHLHNHLHL